MLDMSSLEVLLLGRNNISTISHDSLDISHLSNLTLLDLGNCEVHRMPGNMLKLLQIREILH